MYNKRNMNMDKDIRDFLDRATQKRLYEENRKLLASITRINYLIVCFVN